MKGISKIIIAIVIVFLVSLGYLIFDYTSDINGGKGNTEEVLVTIEKGYGANAVAKVLKDNGIISNSLYFKIYSKKHKVNNLQYGEFTLRDNMSYQEIIEELTTVKDKLAGNKIVIPEGTTLIKIAKIVQDAGFGPAQEFIDIVETSDWSQFKFYQYVQDNELKPFKMEGFLFPATYEFFQGTSLYDIAKTMLAKFDSMITDDMYSQISKMGFTLQDVITIASYVQEEAGSPVNQPDVAAVFLNRLKENSPHPKLESDVSYYYMREFIEPYLGVGRDKSPIEMQKAVNTYLCDGIPVTPVSSPGIDAINAVLNPTPDSPYYFFLTDLTGKYYYAITYDEHLKNIRTMEVVNSGVKK